MFHNCQCGYSWFDNESYTECASCGDTNRGHWDEEGVGSVPDEHDDDEDDDEI
mgnify:CR=1 FL=1